MSGTERRACLWCGDPIPEGVVHIDPQAECCSPECMDEYATQLLVNFYDGGVR